MPDMFQATLHQRLQAFELNAPTYEFGFTGHPMKSQGWTQIYTQRAIAKDKRFAVLTIVENH